MFCEWITLILLLTMQLATEAAVTSNTLEGRPLQERHMRERVVTILGRVAVFSSCASIVFLQLAILRRIFLGTTETEH